MPYVVSWFTSDGEYRLTDDGGKHNFWTHVDLNSPEVTVFQSEVDAQEVIDEYNLAEIAEVLSI